MCTGARHGEILLEEFSPEDGVVYQAEERKHDKDIDHSEQSGIARIVFPIQYRVDHPLVFWGCQEPGNVERGVHDGENKRCPHLFTFELCRNQQLVHTLRSEMHEVARATLGGGYISNQEICWTRRKKGVDQILNWSETETSEVLENSERTGAVSTLLRHTCHREWMP